ncbi:NADAR family protein [Micromonospora sp. NPDC005553]|uniref:NADAR family protein n=1 Tax=Micromonospora sp. NPDC005553 TaxID=3364232 RepID=UPI0036A92C37
MASEPGCRSVDACDTVQIPAPTPSAQMTIYFYGADEVPYGCFSNFSGHGFDLDGHWWTTSEHYFQAQKFPGTRHAELIRRTATPLRAAELGRDRSRPLRRVRVRLANSLTPTSSPSSRTRPTRSPIWAVAPTRHCVRLFAGPKRGPQP